MATSTQIGEVRGLRELRDKLRAIPADLERKALRKGVIAAARLILREAKARYRGLFTNRTGTGLKNLSLMVGRRRGGRGVFARIGVRLDGWYLGLLEAGWRHIGRGKGRRAQLRSGALRGKQIRGRPFMEPAADSQMNAALQEFEKAIVEYIDGLPGK